MSAELSASATIPERVEALVATLQAEDPRFAICYKDETPQQRLIAAIVRPFNDRYLHDYTTVLFGRVYFPSRAWRERVGEVAIYEILRHEAVHLRDARRFPVLFELTYLLLPLPLLCSGRAYWELRGYEESMRVRVELGLSVDDAWIEWVIARFVGPDYLFMLVAPGWLRGRLRRTRAGLERPLDIAASRAAQSKSSREVR